jgi:hypothetical protein
MHDHSRRGKWDPELFATYRSMPDGPRRRVVLDQLLFENEPLLKTLTDQLCGNGAPRRNDLKLPGSTLTGLKDLDWDDAMQAARMAFLKAMDQFNPEKGKLSGYLKFKILYELQCLVQRNGLTYVPRGRDDETIEVALVGVQRALDELSSGHHEDGLMTSDAFDAEDVERWQSSGRWPESLDEARRDVEETRFQRLRNNPSAWLEQAIPRLFVFKPAARVPLFDAYNAYRLDCRSHRAREVSRGELVVTLCERFEVRKGWLRTSRGGSVPALAGVRCTA